MPTKPFTVRKAPAPKPSPEVATHPSGKSWLEVAISLGAKHLLHEPENPKERCSEVIEWKPKGKRPIAHRWFYPHKQLKRESLAARELRAMSVVKHIEAQTTTT